MLFIRNANLVLHNEVLQNASLLCEGERIAAFGRDLKAPAGAEILDAEGQYVAPGLVEIHTHADGVHWFHEEPEVASRNLLLHGVTTALPALYFNLDKQGYLDAIRRINKARREGNAPNIAGFYMEGPYLNPKYGCDREKNAWKGEIRAEDYAAILDEVGEDAKVFCIAPEREGIERYVDDVRKRIPHPRFSVAHSEAEPWQVERFIPKGLCLGTHHTNATGSIPKYPECRGVGVDEAVWMNDDLYAEVICDSHGIHVNPYLIRLILKIKGRDKVILIADSFVADGPVPPGYDGVTDINFDNEGEIAGTKMMLDGPCRNVRKHTGCSLPDVFAFASYNPAKMLGMEEIGEIAVGKFANLVLCDEEIHIKKTILKGSVVE